MSRQAKLYTQASRHECHADTADFQSDVRVKPQQKGGITPVAHRAILQGRRQPIFWARLYLTRFRG